MVFCLRPHEILSACHTFRIEVFRDIRAADEWLGLDREQHQDAVGNRLSVPTGVASIFSVGQAL